MTDVLLKVASFIAIILLGMFANRTGILGQRPANTVSKIVFTFTLPAAIVHAFGSADFTPQLLWLVPLGVVCTMGPWLITLAATRRTEREERVFYLLNIAGFNIGCFALPFVQAFFPATAVVATCMFDAGNALMMTGGNFSLTQVIASGERHEHPIVDIVKGLVKSVPFDAYLVLVALALLGIHIPAQVVAFTEPIANANAFLSLFMVGLMVNFSVNASKVKELLHLIGGRLVLAACMSAVAFLFLPMALEIRVVVAMLLWAPIGSMGPVFTLWAGGDHGLAGLANTITIAIGVVAITAIVLSGAVG